MLAQVKWFNESKGFGFLSADGKDYFVHYKSIIADGFRVLHEGDLVEFTPESSPKGLVARDVKLVKI